MEQSPLSRALHKSMQRSADDGVVKEGRDRSKYRQATGDSLSDNSRSNDEQCNDGDDERSGDSERQALLGVGKHVSGGRLPENFYGIDLPTDNVKVKGESGLGHQRGRRPHFSLTSSSSTLLCFKTISICTALFFTGFAELTPGLALVHLCIVFNVATTDFSIVFVCQGVGLAIGSLLSALLGTRMTCERQFACVLLLGMLANFLSPWMTLEAFAGLQAVVCFSTGYTYSLGFPYIAHLWGSSKHKGAAIQLYTCTYSLSCVVAPLVVGLFLVPLHNVDSEALGCMHAGDGDSSLAVTSSPWLSTSLPTPINLNTLPPFLPSTTSDYNAKTTELDGERAHQAFATVSNDSHHVLLFLFPEQGENTRPPNVMYHDHWKWKSKELHVSLRGWLKRKSALNDTSTVYNTTIMPSSFQYDNEVKISNETSSNTTESDSMAWDSEKNGVKLVRLAFLVGTGGGLAAVVLMTIVSIRPTFLLQSTATRSKPSSVSSPRSSRPNSVSTPGSGTNKGGAIDASSPSSSNLVFFSACSLGRVLFAVLTVFKAAGWAFTTGVMSQYLQTFAIVGLAWSTDAASLLNAVFGGGQLVGRLAALALSVHVSRHPDVTIAVCLTVWTVCPIIMLLPTIGYVSSITTVLGVAIAGISLAPILPSIYLVVDKVTQITTFQSAIMTIGENVGFQIGPIVAGFLLCRFGYISFIFTVLAGCFFQCLIFVCFAKMALHQQQQSEIAYYNTIN